MKKVGIVGIGVMGRGFALNLAERGYEVHMYNRNKARSDSVIQEYKQISSKGFKGSTTDTSDTVTTAIPLYSHETVEELVDALPSPRTIILLLTAGAPVDLFLDKFKSILSKEDVVIDAGNSHFKETDHRIKECPFWLIGCGVSGGEHGARYGASLIAGCSIEAYEKVKELFNRIAAQHNGRPCCGRVGDGGSGHFVKTIHNGIEYCEMQLLQEMYHIIRASNNEGGVKAVLEIFEAWKSEEEGGFLMSICTKILKKVDILEQVMDKAGQKGTGKMCVESAMEVECAAPAIAESVMARFVSQEKERRMAFAERISKNLVLAGKRMRLNEECLKRAFLLCKAVSFVQGFDLIEKMCRREGWEVCMAEVCRIWRAGCIIESKFLERCLEMVNGGKDKSDEEEKAKACTSATNMELSEAFDKIYKKGINELRMICSSAINAGVPVPVFSSCLAWLDGLLMDKQNGQLLQAMRDAFGRHGVEMNDGEVRSIDWLE